MDGYDEEVDPSNWEAEDDDIRFAARNTETAEGEQIDPVKILNDYIPEDWDGKTRLSRNQPQAIAMLKEFAEMFPNILGDGAYEAICLKMLDSYLELQTSVGSRSREEYKEILKNMNTHQSKQEVRMSHADIADQQDAE